MKTVSNLKNDQKSPKPILQTQQVSTFLNEAGYYDYEAELAQEVVDQLNLDLET
ncbi:hypothetical protein LC607_06550 [Nostoc sp. CHAB 5824]|nr:hypothetical protein [Nostoc sp. CHAB 5824]